eukprot:CAMPEP_0185724586 /NCGR_PEP_ID=MMETSP1171-20130828/1023_1 /TAXON_ID=374046 /ORGANISM="Helicotheca tamensis, Strain CCMP826" /LENGTH=375 /DNA_ID=CAMNT_0028392467 /DNA_START=106 /DNA_END=1233 /DNA_ORIENTATION=+
MSSSTPEHAADEAGGEAIYSSDGLPSLPSPPPPIPQPKKQEDDKDDDAVIEYDGTINATSAFEVFSGKVFSSSSSMKHVDKGETPLEKLARLEAEVSSLESDLSSSPHSSSITKSKEGDEALRTMAKELAVRLSSINVRENMVSRQENLTELVQLEMDKLSAAAKKEEGKEGVSAESNKIVYELYGNAASAAAAPSNLEERLRKLELLLGSSSKDGDATVTVLKRLEQAENLATRVDEASLEKAAARAKVIRVDLEAAAKARLKLTALNSNKSSTTTTDDDSKTISTLYDQLQSLENMTRYLPAVVSRLQDLALLHTTSANFATRLSQVEQMADTSEKMMKDVEMALEKMGEGLEENVRVVKENVMVLDERMKAL